MIRVVVVWIAVFRFVIQGSLIGGMASGCPINNLIPEWNDLIYKGKWEEGS